MQKPTIIFAIVVFSLFSGCPGMAKANEGLGISVKGGTLGIGADLSVALFDTVRLRGGINYLTFSFDSTISNIDYEFEPDFNSLSLLLDWHPFGGAFFISGGAYFTNNSIDVTGGLDDDYFASRYIDTSFLRDVASVSGDVEFNSVAPYIGIGWRSNQGETGWGLACDLGVMFQGSPEVNNLRLNGPYDINNIPAVQEYLAIQEDKIEDDISNFQYYPVASLALIYNF